MCVKKATVPFHRQTHLIHPEEEGGFRVVSTLTIQRGTLCFRLTGLFLQPVFQRQWITLLTLNTMWTHTTKHSALTRICRKILISNLEISITLLIMSPVLTCLVKPHLTPTHQSPTASTITGLAWEAMGLKVIINPHRYILLKLGSKNRPLMMPRILGFLPARNSKRRKVDGRVQVHDPMVAEGEKGNIGNTHPLCGVKCFSLLITVRISLHVFIRSSGLTCQDRCFALLKLLSHYRPNWGGYHALMLYLHNLNFRSFFFEASISLDWHQSSSHP